MPVSTAAAAATTTTTTSSNTKKKEPSPSHAGETTSTTTATTTTTTQQLPRVKIKLSSKKVATANASVTAASASNTTTTTTTPPLQQQQQSSATNHHLTKQYRKIIYGLQRRHHKHLTTTFATNMADYTTKVPQPSMDLNTLLAKCENQSLTEFVTQLRRIPSNALRYHTNHPSARQHAIQFMESVQELIAAFLPTTPNVLLFEHWKECVQILNTLYTIQNTNQQQLIFYFLYPVPYYTVEWPPDYLSTIPQPMDFGTITGKLVEGGHYTNFQQFEKDCRLVFQNCIKYYENKGETGKAFIEQANTLNRALTQQINKYSNQIGTNTAARKKKPLQLRPPSPPLLLQVIAEMRQLVYTHKATNTSQPATVPFDYPVPVDQYPDYPNYVKEPMDFSTIEQKIKAAQYPTPEDFEYDVRLIFRNCEAYNNRGKQNSTPTLIVFMSRFLERSFRRIFYAKLKGFEDSIPSSPTAKSKGSAKTAPTSVAATASTVSPGVTSSAPAPKRIKLDISAAAAAAAKASASSASASLQPIPKDKPAAPRISISAALLSSATSSRNSVSLKKDQVLPNQPIPLHIAISKLKEAFPLRRVHKSLLPWEQDCAKYYKELLKHPWLKSNPPKFIFHVPVSSLYPHLKEAYAAKIKRPMDLTTVECQLLVGNRYAGPDDFLRDIALVFGNAVRFNKDGRDVGDPLSCAYYDASVHLLRYSRWLSMELLSPYLVNKSEHVDENPPGMEGLPPLTWRLTTGNANKAKQEMEAIVMNEPIDSSSEGDRYTWQEAECERLLKALRHQSDYKYMVFFLTPNYPADYAAYISKPMDWERVNRTLRKRGYDKFGEVIEDLRLIFKNALKYNGAHKGTDTISGQAYASAEYMSTKLESAINRMMVSVSDRLERERIDDAILDREREVHDGADDALDRESTKNKAVEEDDPDDEDYSPMPTSVRINTSRIRQRAAAQARETDVEVFEDEQHHERTDIEFAKLQKTMFEKQRESCQKKRSAIRELGIALFSRLAERMPDRVGVKKDDSKSIEGKTTTSASLDDVEMKEAAGGSNKNETSKTVQASAVRDLLEQPHREMLKMTITKKKRKTKKSRSFLILE